jgi:hypothetical protein
MKSHPLQLLIIILFKVYSRSWLVKTRRIILGILKPSRYFSCWRHQRAIILFWSEVLSKKYYCTLWLPSPGAIHIFSCFLSSFWIEYNKTIIEFGFRMISRIIKASVCVIHLSLRWITNTNLGLRDSRYLTQPQSFNNCLLLIVIYKLTVICQSDCTSHCVSMHFQWKLWKVHSH